jgi:hypothetical protein
MPYADITRAPARRVITRTVIFVTHRALVPPPCRKAFLGRHEDLPLSVIFYPAMRGCETPAWRAGERARRGWMPET